MARNWIRFMIIGVIMTIVLLFFFPLSFKYMWVQWYDNFSAKNIFVRVSEIFTKILTMREELQEINQTWWWNMYMDDASSTRTRPTIDPSNYEL